MASANVPASPTERRRLLPLPPRFRPVERLIEFGLLSCGLLSVAITLAIAGTVLFNSIEFFQDREYDRLAAEAEKKGLPIPAATDSDYSQKYDALSVQLREGIDQARAELARASAALKAAPKEELPAASARVRAAEAAANRAEEEDSWLPRKKVSLGYFLTGTEWTAGFKNARYGILPLLTGTLMVALIAAIVALPIGLTTAIYLSEYAGPRFRGIVKPTLELLAGIPTVVYGYFALTAVTPFLSTQWLDLGFLGVGMPIYNLLYIPGIERPNNQISGGIVVGIMILPMIASLSEDAIRAVPRSLREGAYALGANQFETSVRVVVPAALSGIVASFILAISRAIGETMAVSLACGGEARLSLDPRDGIATMTSFIVRIAQGDVQHGSTDFNSLFAVAAVLFFMTFAMNVVAQWVLSRYRQVYQ